MPSLGCISSVARLCRAGHHPVVSDWTSHEALVCQFTITVQRLVD